MAIYIKPSNEPNNEPKNEIENHFTSKNFLTSTLRSRNAKFSDLNCLPDLTLVHIVNGLFQWLEDYFNECGIDPKTFSTMLVNLSDRINYLGEDEIFEIRRGLAGLSETNSEGKSLGNGDQRIEFEKTLSNIRILKNMIHDSLLRFHRVKFNYKFDFEKIEFNRPIKKSVMVKASVRCLNPVKLVTEENGTTKRVMELENQMFDDSKFKSSIGDLKDKTRDIFSLSDSINHESIFEYLLNSAINHKNNKNAQSKNDKGVYKDKKSKSIGNFIIDSEWKKTPKENLDAKFNTLVDYISWLEKSKTELLNKENSQDCEKHSYSVLEWATIFFYADETKLLPANRYVKNRIISFIEFHCIETTFEHFRTQYYQAKKRINVMNDYPIKKLEFIMPFLIENYQQTVIKVENDINFLENELDDY